jgi:hypothetical protein
MPKLVVESKSGGIMKRNLLLAIMSILVLAPVAAFAEDGQEPFRFDLTPASPAIANCLPNATARITVFPKADSRGVDTLDVKAEGLPANTDFVVFLTQNPAAGAPPFGAAQYIADFTTNRRDHPRGVLERRLQWRPLPRGVESRDNLVRGSRGRRHLLRPGRRTHHTVRRRHAGGSRCSFFQRLSARRAAPLVGR